MTSAPDQPIGGVEIAPGIEVPRGALRFAAARSSGPGGQHVNKVSTKVELRIALEDIPISQAAKSRLRGLASHLITSQGELTISSDESRSQSRNKEACFERLRELVIRAQVAPKPRRKTKPTKASKRRRVEDKRQRGEVKRRRQRPGSDDA